MVRIWLLIALAGAWASFTPLLLAGEESHGGSGEPAVSLYRSWVADLDSDEFAVRQHASASILRAGEPALEVLIELVPSGSPEVHERGLQLLETCMLGARPSRMLLAKRGLEQWAVTGGPQLARKARTLLEQTRAEREARAIARIRELGGRVDEDGETSQLAVRIGHWQGSIRDMRLLAELEQVTRISLEESELDDDVLRFVGGRSELKRLYLAGSKISGTGLKELRDLKNLMHLSLKNLPIDAAKLRQMPDLPQLRGLGMDGTKVGDSALAELKRFPLLETLWLEGTPITDAGLVHLQELPNLRVLYLANTQVAGEGLVTLRNVRSLRYLSLMGVQLRQDSCQHLAQLRQLETLGLDGTTITDAQLADLEPLSNLRVLWLSKTELTDGCIEPLTRLPSLNKVYLSDSKLSSAGLKELRQRLPRCEVIFEEPDK